VRGIAVSDTVRERITTCTDLDRVTLYPTYPTRA